MMLWRDSGVLGISDGPVADAWGRLGIKMFEMDYMIPAMIFSMFGMGLVIYAKKQVDLVAAAAGVTLMAIPCVVFTPWVLWVLGAVTVAAWVYLRRLAEG